MSDELFGSRDSNDDIDLIWETQPPILLSVSPDACG